MRVLTWNMAKNRRADAWAFLERVEPDVALLQEAPAAVTQHAVDRGWRTALWTEAWPDGTWGSAVLARYARLELEWADRSRGAVLLARGRIDGVGMASVASIHVRANHESRLVVPPLRETLAEIRARLLPAFIVGGDLNTARHAAFIWRDNGTWSFGRSSTQRVTSASRCRQRARGSLSGEGVAQRPPGRPHLCGRGDVLASRTLRRPGHARDSAALRPWPRCPGTEPRPRAGANLSPEVTNLKSHLWECAEVLRGSPVDRARQSRQSLPRLRQR
jgi:hypothetical protein